MRLPGAFLLFLLIAGCNPPPYFAESKPIKNNAWKAEKTVHIEPEINDTTQAYRLFFSVRTTRSYPYRNLWLFVQTTFPSGHKTVDTVNCPLAYKSGKWIGRSSGEYIDHLIVYKDNYRFQEQGSYQYSIQHGMRDSVLHAVGDIGMRIEVAQSKP